MKFTTKHQINAQFSMSSMTDIIFLLLIFLLLTISFVPPTGINVQLPVSQSLDIQVSQVTVTITSALDYYVEDQKTTLAQLKEVLQERLAMKGRIVLLQVDKSVPVAHMIKVADIATALQAQVSIATRLEE